MFLQPMGGECSETWLRAKVECGSIIWRSRCADQRLVIEVKMTAWGCR